MLRKDNHVITKRSVVPFCLLPQFDRSAGPQGRLQTYLGDVLLLFKADRVQVGRILSEESTSSHHHHKGKLLVCLCFQGCLRFLFSSSLSSPGKLRTDVPGNVKITLQVSRVSSLPHTQRYWCGRTCMPCCKKGGIKPVL